MRLGQLQTRPGQLGAADGLDLLAQVRDDRPQRLPVRPGVEVAQLALDDRDRLGNLRACGDRAGVATACSSVPRSTRVDAGHVAGLDRRRHAQIHDDQRPPAPRRRRRLEMRRCVTTCTGASTAQKTASAAASDRAATRAPALSPATVEATASARSRVRLATTSRCTPSAAEVAGHLHAGGAGADDHDVAVGQRQLARRPAAPPPRPPTARRRRGRSRRGSGRRRAAPPAPRRAGTRRRRARPSSAARTWPRISASPSTSDSRPAQTRNRWVAAALPHRKPVIGRGPAAACENARVHGVVVEAAARAPVDLGAIAGGQHERLDAGGRRAGRAGAAAASASSECSASAPMPTRAMAHRDRAQGLQAGLRRAEATPRGRRRCRQAGN